MDPMLTTRAVAQRLGVGDWAVREAVDNCGIQFPRAGLYRLVPESALPVIRAELEKRGRLQPTEAGTA